MTIPDVDSKWQEVGVALNLDSTSLDKIKAKHGNQSRRKREMFRLAVNNGVTWKEVIQALWAVRLTFVARSVCNIFDISLKNGLSFLVSSAADEVLLLLCWLCRVYLKCAWHALFRLCTGMVGRFLLGTG